ncbi:hypothetical protein JYU34_014952 [Plutella xylostella]|uniref:Lipase domain-containing protein n=2 Tax=Plutella xylostella TaxID=51655 RepID=A0ABQ7Q7B6_PLUXY|nr:hypothetical protein JYU34_014952 [Plutella xylostella]
MRQLAGAPTLLALLPWLALAAASYEPRPRVGVPAGLIPECPGVDKNASISPRMLQQLQVVSHRASPSGPPVRRAMPVLAAAKMLAKDKFFDFKRKKTVLYAVGFFDSSVFPHSQAVASSYSRRGYNVLVSETFNFLTHIYPVSVRLSRSIGKKLGELLVKLTQQGLTADNLELVGLSLGAHIVGYAAKHFYSVTGQKPSRVTGLDPAGPCFRSLPPNMRLDASDGQRVDVLHTNIDGFGMAEPIGHVDFYANGGEFQPGDIPYVPCLVVCSHLRSVLYWWQALEHAKKFIGVQCDSVQEARFANCYNNSQTNYLGSETDFRKPGIYYLPTHNEFPYYRGKEGLKSENEIYKSTVREINRDEIVI